MTNAIALLEDWKDGHKNRSVKIEIDNGYGATCWRVDLYIGNKPAVEASEVCFVMCQKEEIPSHVVFVNNPWEEHEEDWPGLAKTIIAAVERANELGHLSLSRKQKPEA